MKNRLYGLMLALSLCLGVRATVVGYDRFYNPATNTIIDLLYDAHVYQDKLSVRDFHRRPQAYIEERLYFTEKRLMQALRKLNDNTPGCVDVIWEEGIYNEDIVEQFIGHSKRLIKDQFQGLNFIASDITRDAFEQLFNAHGPRHLDREVAGISMNNPMPLPDDRVAGIIANSGDVAWQEYEKYHKKTVQNLQAYFNPLYLHGTTFHRNELRKLHAWCALTDIEMLSYILSSNKPHIIVYAGGWHSRNIAAFLENNLKLKRVYSAHDGGYELYQGHLDLIDSLNGYDESLYTAALGRQNEPDAICAQCGRLMKDH